MLDALQVRGVQRLFEADLPETPMLFVEFHGTEASVAEQARRFGEIAAENGGGDFAWTTKPGGAQQALAGAPRRLLGEPGAAARRAAVRHRCLRADLAPRRMRRGDAGDIAAERPDRADRRPRRRRQFPCHPADRHERSATRSSAAEAFAERLVLRAIAMDGTCTGEHGVGQKKIAYLDAEHGEEALDLMRRIKAAFDPQNLFNPGKIFAV